MKLKKTLVLFVVLICVLNNGCDRNDYSGEQIESSNSDYSQVSSSEENTEIITLDDVDKYNNLSYIEINGNRPFFTEEEKTDINPFEYYSPLDELGRCGVAFANICKELMPTEDREAIGQVKPSGWHTVKYNGIIDGNYLYNRCHLIGYQLAGENANELNLITGTRYLNMVGMLEFENSVSAYVEETNNHVLYRVTPIFEGENLVAKGVEIEAWSVEDGGKGICFNVFCYNVQPGIMIDYATGDSWLLNANTQDNHQNSSSFAEEWADANSDSEQEIRKFILNKDTKKFHLPQCASVNRMSDENKEAIEGTAAKMKEKGYIPCARCLEIYK